MKSSMFIPVLMIGGFFIMFGAILRLAVIASRKALENMQRMADQLRLKVEENQPRLGFYAPPEASGIIRGKRVRLYNYTSGTGKSKSTWAALSVTPGVSNGLTFDLIPEGFPTRLIAAFGGKEIKVGDEAFDRAWFIQTNAPDYFRAALLPEVQQKLLASKGRWKLADGAVVYIEAGTFSDVARCERFRAAVEAACDLADIAEVYTKYTKS